MPIGAPRAAQGAVSGEATLCGTYETTNERGVKITRPEFYVFDAINAKLETFPMLRERFGASEVSTCEDGRRFMTVYRALAQERPEYFAEPAERANAASSPNEGADEEDFGSSEQAIQLGSASSHKAVVFLEWPSGGECTGLSVSTYGLITAAHCIPSNGWHQLWVKRQNGSSLTKVLDGLVWVWFQRHPNYTGTADWSDDIAVGTLWFDYPASSLPDPSSNAMRLAASVSVNTGTKLDIRGYGATDVWGSNVGTQRKGEAQVTRVSSNYIGTLPVTGDSTPNVPCMGDSGGPISRQHDSRDIAYGVTSGSSGFSQWQRCSVSNDETFFTRVNSKLSWIEGLLGFSCKRYSTSSPSGTIARCW